MKKFKKVLYHGTWYSIFGASNFFLGIYICKRKNNDSSLYQDYPAFPHFATVSAATTFLPEKEHGDVSIGSRTSEIMKYGFPGLSNVRSYDDFILSYDQRNRIAHWVFEHLTSDRLNNDKRVSRSRCDYKEDESVHPFFRSTNQDYKGSGYDRGHLAAAGNHKLCHEHYNQTFFLTNIAPQVGAGFNRNIWNNLEIYTRKLTRLHKNVYVCTGPLFLPRTENDGKMYVKYQVIGPNQVAVPTHFFKIIVMENAAGQFEMEAYVLPNKSIEDSTPLNLFQVPPETIERASGLLFFSRIAREKLSKINGRQCTYI